MAYKENFLDASSWNDVSFWFEIKNVLNPKLFAIWKFFQLFSSTADFFSETALLWIRLQFQTV